MDAQNEHYSLLRDSLFRFVHFPFLSTIYTLFPVKLKHVKYGHEKFAVQGLCCIDKTTFECFLLLDTTAAIGRFYSS